MCIYIYICVCIYIYIIYIYIYIMYCTDVVMVIMQYSIIFHVPFTGADLAWRSLATGWELSTQTRQGPAWQGCRIPKLQGSVASLKQAGVAQVCSSRLGWSWHEQDFGATLRLSSLSWLTFLVTRGSWSRFLPRFHRSQVKLCFVWAIDPGYPPHLQNI